MKQLLLDLSLLPRPTLSNFIVGGNSELLQTLKEVLAGQSSERFLYIWGAAGSGRSHLLEGFIDAALEKGHRAHYLDCLTADPLKLAQLIDCEWVAVDHVEALTAEFQISLFNLYNQLREQGAGLLVSGNQPPAQLTLRSDLVTRLGWGLIYQVHALSDADKIAALQAHAEQRGFQISRVVIEHLLQRWRRDMPSLLAVLDALDQLSLEMQRPITLPLLRQALQSLEN